MKKLGTLAKIKGTELRYLLAEAATKTAVPGICINEDCSYTCDVEPDQTQGHCENCNTKTVSSCLVLAGMI